MEDKKDLNIENQEQGLQEISMEDLMGAMNTLQPIELNVENLEGVKFDKKEFQEGLKFASRYAGMVTALINVGLTAKDCVDFIINERTIDMNLKLNTENNKTTIETSKISSVKIEQQQL